jgi:hypothetical protein
MMKFGAITTLPPNTQSRQNDATNEAVKEDEAVKTDDACSLRDRVSVVTSRHM